MKIEKRPFTPGKTYRATHRILDSYENTLAELSSLYVRLQNRIKELSIYLRKVENQKDQASIEAMNHLKYYRTQIRLSKQELERVSASSWRDQLPAIRDLFEKAETLLLQVPDYAIQDPEEDGK